jgi:hypothetical protein
MTTNQYRVMINQSNYSEWEFIPMDKMLPQIHTNIPINPIENRLFSKDIILYDNSHIRISH